MIPMRRLSYCSASPSNVTLIAGAEDEDTATMPVGMLDATLMLELGRRSLYRQVRSFLCVLLLEEPES